MSIAALTLHRGAHRPSFDLQDQSLGSWQVKAQVGDGNPVTYKFPSKFSLKAGATVTVGA